MSKPVGPYTPIVAAGDWLIASGQIGIVDGALVDGGMGAQLHQALANLRSLVEGRGARIDQIVKTTVFLSDMELFAPMNEVYAEHFGDHRPARATVAVRTLPKNVDVEIECIARVSG